MAFSRTTKLAALHRQHHRCAICGTYIADLGQAGQSEHDYGEPAEAHHMQHRKLGGADFVDNCVVICRSCHYTAHEGGAFRGGQLTFQKSEFPHYNG